jgi:hypothetical protein
MNEMQFMLAAAITGEALGDLGQAHDALGVSVEQRIGLLRGALDALTECLEDVGLSYDQEWYDEAKRVVTEVVTGRPAEAEASLSDLDEFLAHGY